MPADVTSFRRTSWSPTRSPSQPRSECTRDCSAGHVDGHRAAVGHGAWLRRSVPLRHKRSRYARRPSCDPWTRVELGCGPTPACRAPSRRLPRRRRRALRMNMPRPFLSIHAGRAGIGRACRCWRRRRRDDVGTIPADAFSSVVWSVRLEEPRARRLGGARLRLRRTARDQAARAAATCSSRTSGAPWAPSTRTAAVSGDAPPRARPMASAACAGSPRSAVRAPLPRGRRGGRARAAPARGRAAPCSAPGSRRAG